MGIEIRKAIRQRVWLKIGITGPSGSGKTFGAIPLALGLASHGKVCVIDTENESASLYADKWAYDVICLHAPFTTTKYAAALDAILQGGYDVAIIDSLTHEWAASGGILDAKTSKDARGGNSFANWGEMKQLHDYFMERMLQSPIHVIATLRSKMDYVLESDEKGKQVPRKIGLAPISQSETEYEFSLLFDIDRNTHLAIASKDRTSLFEGRSLHLDEAVGKELRAWLDSGKPITTPAPATAQVSEPPEAKVDQVPAPEQTGCKIAAPPGDSATVSVSPAGTVAKVNAGERKPAPEVAQPRPTEKTSSPTQTTINPIQPGTIGAEAVSTPVNPTQPTSGDTGQAVAVEPLIQEQWIKAMAELAEVTVGMNLQGRRKLVKEWEKAGPGELAALCKEIEILRSVQVSPAEFVNGMDRPDDGEISIEQYTALNTLIEAYHLNRDALRAYALKAGALLPGKNGPTLRRYKADKFCELRNKIMDKKTMLDKETRSARTIRIINATVIPTTPTKETR